VYVLVAGLVLFVFGWAPYWLGSRATYGRFHFPDKENAGLTPASFDLGFEELRFNSADGVPLSGWWVPVDHAKGSAVLIHGVNRSRIEMVKKLPFLHSHGWNALLFDLRNHGESGGSATTFGALEKGDAEAAVAVVRERSDVPVILWGVSLGAATAMLAAAEDPIVAGVVCDSSYRSLSDTVRHHLQLFRSFRWWLRIVPSWPVADEVLFWMGRKGGYDTDAVDIEAAARHLAGRPVLFVANTGDRRMPKEIAFDLEAAVGDTARVLVVPSESHGGAYRDGTPQYERAVAELLQAVAAPATLSQVTSGAGGAASKGIKEHNP
jgi:pimeloyl-ACP methyl ester carboxylesterase